MNRKYFILFLLFSFANLNHAQDDVREGDFFAIGISYGINIPIGTLANRFGTNFHAGLSLDWYKSKFNGSYGIEGNLLFGNNVKEDVISSLRLDNFAILGFDGQYADVFLRERGTYLGVCFKKILIPNKNNFRSGFAAALGIGALQHKVRIQVETRNAPNLDGEYLKGYDRNTVGPAFKQQFSYTHVGKNKNVNYAISFEIMEGITKNRRAINFDSFEKDTKSRFDVLLGIDFKWYIPIKDMREAEEIFY